MACTAPRVTPLTGIPVREVVPKTAVPPGHSRLIFRWDYDDPLFAARGEGVARIAAPDSIRIDFFADQGLGAGGAILIGDTLRTAGEDGTRYLPPVPLLWAAVGVLRATGADTTMRRQGDTLWVELAGSYRAALVGRQLIGLGRMEKGRWRERVFVDSVQVAYRHYTARRKLTLTAMRRMTDAPFDPSIWRP